MFEIVAPLLLLAFQQPGAPKPEPPAQTKAAELNLLGATDAAAGESRRNENVQFNLIDNNALKYLNIRLGTNATIVTEFRPDRKYFGTEFGATPAGAIHLGAPRPVDAFHGGVSFTRSDSIFNARSFFQAGQVQPAHENDYGITAGTGVWRGAHLSADGSQQTLRGSVNGNVLAPLAAERTPLTTDPALRRLVQRWIDAYPLALPNRTDIDPRALNTNSPQSIDTSASNIRLDQTLGPRDRFFAQHAFTNQKVRAFQLVPGQNPDTNTKSHNVRLTWNHRFGDRSLLDVTFGMDRVHSLLTPEPNAVGPQVVVGTAYQSLGPGATIPIDRRLTRFRQAVLYRHTAGKHQISIGGELDRLRNNGLESSSERGNYYFRSDFGRDAITNFRLGIASRYSAAVGDGHRGFRWFEQQVFAGDVWKARSNLAVSFGLRYSPVTAPHEVNGLSPVDFRCDCSTLGPQFGIAWQTPGLGVVRAAYGLHFGDIYSQTLQQVRWDPPNFLKVEVQAPASILAPLAGVYLGPGAPSAVRRSARPQVALLAPVHVPVGARTGEAVVAPTRLHRLAHAPPVHDVVRQSRCARPRHSANHRDYPGPPSGPALLRAPRGAQRLQSLFRRGPRHLRSAGVARPHQRSVVLVQQGDRHRERLHEHGGRR